MRNQFFGDVNDYVKYGLLRTLCDPQQFAVTVCWALTQDTATPDGRRTAYLDKDEAWRHYAPQLFDLLRMEIRRGNRDVSSARELQLVPDARFNATLIPGGGPERVAFFEELWQQAAGTELIFFDPDIGIETPSVGYRSRRSSAYVYWHELLETYRRGYSVLVYQHFPRKPHEAFARQREGEMLDLLSATEVWSYSSSNVLFLLAVQAEHTSLVATRSREFEQRWGPIVRVTGPQSRR